MSKKKQIKPEDISPKISWEWKQEMAKQNGESLSQDVEDEEDEETEEETDSDDENPSETVIDTDNELDSSDENINDESNEVSNPSLDHISSGLSFTPLTTEDKTEENKDSGSGMVADNG